MQAFGNIGNFYVVPYSEGRWNSIKEEQLETKKKGKIECYKPYQKKIDDWIVYHDSNVGRICVVHNKIKQVWAIFKRIF